MSCIKEFSGFVLKPSKKRMENGIISYSKINYIWLMLMTPSFFKSNRIPLLMGLISVFLYFSFAYHLQRTEYVKLIMLYSALFFLFYKLVQSCKHNIQFLTYLAFLFRAVFILAIPNLSQDFYRFIWDGRIILEGINPYLNTVQSFMDKGEFPVAQAQELYAGMGLLNAGHFTNYPPINQLCFVIAGFFTGKSILGSVFVMRLLIIAADFGTLHFGKKLLKKLNIPVYNIFYYILNPFIIIELTGNLHFESVMIFFLVWSLYLLHVGKWQFAAFALALSISVKLIPLLFLPLFYQWFTSATLSNRVKRHIISTEESEDQSHQNSHENIRNVSVNKWIPAFLKIKKLMMFYGITMAATILLFAPFFSFEFLNNYIRTVGLWFNNFEFNASLYYIFREIGRFFRGYYGIKIVGIILPVFVVLFILRTAFFRKNITSVQLITSMLLVLSFYYFMATTVHPWYLATLLILSVFTKYKFPLVWSFMIILSYLSYIDVGKADKSENLWVIALEYSVVFGVLLYEVIIPIKKNKTTSRYLSRTKNNLEN